MISLNKLCREFNTNYGLETFNEITPELLSKAAKLAQEEVDEAKAEVIGVPFSTHNAAKELIDIIYVTMQQAGSMGIDLDAGLIAVHMSNMSKTVSARHIQEEVEIAKARYPDVVPVQLNKETYRLFSPSLNKVVKPSRYKVADVTGCLP